MNGICWASGSEIKARYDDISAKFQAGDPLVAETVDGLAKLIGKSRTQGTNIFRTVDPDGDHYEAERQLAYYGSFHQLISIRLENPKECFWLLGDSYARISAARLASVIYYDYIHRIMGGYERLVRLGNQSAECSVKLNLVKVN